MDLTAFAGQLVMAGFPGTTLPPDFAQATWPLGAAHSPPAQPGWATH